jgi:hypothetical protein
MFNKIKAIIAAMVGSPLLLLPAKLSTFPSEAGPDCCLRGASSTGCSMVQEEEVLGAWRRAHHKVPAGSPVCITAIILSHNARLISGVYVDTPSQLRESTPSLAHYALLITRRGSEWHVDNVPAAIAL